MARGLRSPAVLMTVYVAIFGYAGPWFSVHGPAHRTAFQLAVAILLAVLAARGSRAARVLMISYSAVGVAIAMSGSTQPWSPQVPGRLGCLACFLVQIALLVSTPMYQRTRLGWTPGRFPPARFLPAPRLWMITASAAAAVGVCLLPIHGDHPVACPPRHVFTAHPLTGPPAPCLADGAGYPVAFRYDGGIYTQSGGFHWLNAGVPGGLQLTVLAADLTMWGLSVLLVLYVIWLSKSREY